MLRHIHDYRSGLMVNFNHIKDKRAFKSISWEQYIRMSVLKVEHRNLTCYQMFLLIVVRQLNLQQK